MLRPLQSRRSWCRKSPVSPYGHIGHTHWVPLEKGLFVSSPEYALDQLIPHRSGMLLIDRLVSASLGEAITEATPTRQWPLRQADYIGSLVAVELGAQTAGVLVGHQERKVKGAALHGKGWLVGIREAALHRQRFRIGTPIRTHARPGYHYKTFHEIETEILVDRTLAAHIVLQVFWIETV